MIQRFGELSFDLLTTLAINVRKDGLGAGVFDRTVVSNQRLTRDELAQFREFLNSRGHDMLVELDQWLTLNVTKKKPDQTVPEVFDSGLAMIQFITERPDEKESLREFLIRRQMDGAGDE